MVKVKIINKDQDEEMNISLGSVWKIFLIGYGLTLAVVFIIGFVLGLFLY